MRKVLNAATGKITIDEAFTLPKPDPAEALAAEREAAIQEAVQDAEAERIAAIRAQVVADFAGATTIAEIQQIRDQRRAARRGPRV